MHQRMGHIGLERLQKTAQCTMGMEDIGQIHPLFACQSCQMAKMTKVPRGKPENRLATKRGERFHMDFGFLRGPKHLMDLRTRKWHGKRTMIGQEAADYQPIITSHDGYSSYLLVVDAFTRASFVFMTKCKPPSIATITMFLTKYGLKDNSHCSIRTDQGGELARSKAF